MEDFDYLHSTFDSKKSQPKTIPPKILIALNDQKSASLLKNNLANYLKVPVFHFSEKRECLEQTLRMEGSFPICLITEIGLDETESGPWLIEELIDRDRPCVAIVLDHQKNGTPLRRERDLIDKVLPFDTDWKIILNAVNQILNLRFGVKEEQLSFKCGERELLGSSPKILKLLERIKTLTPSQFPLHIKGEPGTEKDGLAQAIHHHLGGTEKNIIICDCGDFSGKFLKLSQEAELPFPLTVVLREAERIPAKEFQLLNRLIKSRKYRFIFTSTCSPQEIPLKNWELPLWEIPPLRERKGDIPQLISHLCGKHLTFSKDALEVMVHYGWPGNLRELEFLVERLKISFPHKTILPQDLPKKLVEQRENTAGFRPAVSLPPVGINLKEILVEIEDSLIMQALIRTNGNKNQASKLLMLNRTTLIEKMKKRRLGDPATSQKTPDLD